MKLVQIVSIVCVVLLLSVSEPPKVVPTSAPIVVMPAVAAKKIVKKKTTHYGLRMFLSRMSKVESNHQSDVISKYGMLGKYQFAPRTMRGILGKEVTQEQFLQDETLQDKAMLTLMRRNRSFLQKVIREFSGQMYNGILVTESGILAGAHLVGPVGVLAYFYPEQYDATTIDRNGTTVSHYMRTFEGMGLQGL